jgi:hypothetical protein
MSPERKRCVALMLAAGVLCSCMSITGYRKNEVLRGGEPRAALAFESPAVAEAFATAVRERWDANAAQVKREHFGILFVCCYDRTTSLSENAFYNDQARACDLNGDNLITDAEVCFYRRGGACVPQGKWKGPGRLEPLPEPPLLPTPTPTGPELAPPPS